MLLTFWHAARAEHEAPVTSVGLSPNGLKACIGTEDGVVGTLDVVTHQYSTLVRSHCAAVNDVAVHPDRCERCIAWASGRQPVCCWSEGNCSSVQNPRDS